VDIEVVRFGYLQNCVLSWAFVEGFKFALIGDAWRPDPDGPGGQRREPGKVESCVPDGEYQLVPHSGTAIKDVWCCVNPALGVYRWPQDIDPGQ
jgi:hypothetical protein